MQEDNSINIIFYLGNIRSGTKYIASFLSKNARNTSSLHEPFPDMFGPSILARHENRDKAIRRLFALKRRAIRLFSRKNYFESNHAFLKSFCHVAMESFPQMKLLHSIRNPLEVALSAVNRKTLTDRYIPFSWIKQYKKKGQSYWRWTFTGKEPLFQCFDLEKITLFQWYLLEWIEVENRAMDFLRQYQKDGDCFTLLVPQDLNDPEKMSQMMDFFHLEQRKKNLDFRGKRNRNHCSTLLNDSHRVQFDQLIAAVPKSFLEIFTKPPYSDCPWADLFYTDKE